jgi:hypothetical protein
VKPEAALFLIVLAWSAGVAVAANSSLPGAGFTGDRYRALWTKSPFAIATAEAGSTSTDFELVGMAEFDGVSYASLVDKHTQEHFVLTSEKPVKDLTLLSLRRDANGASAVIERQGEQLVLREENAAPTPAAIAAASGPPQLTNVPPGWNPARFAMPPEARFHRPRIVVPPAPQNP